MTTCPSGVNYMHLIDHGRSHIEKTYKRPIVDRLIRNFLSTTLSKPFNFKIIMILIMIVKPFYFFSLRKLKK